MPVHPGDKPKRGPLNSAAWNRVEEASDHYHRTKARGQGGSQRPTAVKLDRVTVKNNTGSDRVRGDIVELGTYCLPTLENEVFWFNGETVNLAAGRTAFGVLLQPLPQNQFGDCLLVGVCEAKVNVTNASHGYAVLASGSTAIVSASRGPIRILHKPASTGTQRCAVLLGYESPRVYLGKADAAISRGSSGMVSRYEGASGTETDTGIDDTCKNKFANVALGKWVAYIEIGGAFYLLAAECG